MSTSLPEERARQAACGAALAAIPATLPVYVAVTAGVGALCGTVGMVFIPMAVAAFITGWAMAKD